MRKIGRKRTAYERRTCWRAIGRQREIITIENNLNDQKQSDQRGEKKDIQSIREENKGMMVNNISSVEGVLTSIAEKQLARSGEGE